MPNPSRPHEMLIEQFMRGEPVPIESQAEFFDAELQRLSVIGQLAEIHPQFYEMFKRDNKAYPPNWVGTDCFLCSINDRQPMWFFFERESPRRFYCRQLTWEESGAIAAAVRIRAPRRPESEAV